MAENNTRQVKWAMIGKAKIGSARPYGMDVE
jgi:hypothetical protein